MLDKMLLIELREYLQKHLILPAGKICEDMRQNLQYVSAQCIRPDELEDFIKNNRKAAFKEVLFKFIDQKGASDSEIYKKAGVDRRHFSKIRSKTAYKIGKNTVIALALALELNKQETDLLLSSAGYSLSNSETFDLIVQFFLEKKIYDLHSLNQALAYFSLKPLSGALE